MIEVTVFVFVLAIFCADQRARHCRRRAKHLDEVVCGTKEEWQGVSRAVLSAEADLYFRMSHRWEWCSYVVAFFLILYCIV